MLSQHHLTFSSDHTSLVKQLWGRTQAGQLAGQDFLVFLLVQSSGLPLGGHLFFLSQRAISESDHCSLMLRAAPAPHTESLSALQRSTLSFTVPSVESEWSAPSLS